MEGAWVPNGTEEPTHSLTSRLHLCEEKTCCSNHPANDHRYLIDGIYSALPPKLPLLNPAPQSRPPSLGNFLDYTLGKK